MIGLTCSKQDLDAFGDRLVNWIKAVKNIEDPEPTDPPPTTQSVKPEPEPEPSLNSPRKLLVE